MQKDFGSGRKTDLPPFACHSYFGIGGIMGMEEGMGAVIDPIRRFFLCHPCILVGDLD